MGEKMMLLQFYYERENPGIYARMRVESSEKERTPAFRPEESIEETITIFEKLTQGI